MDVKLRILGISAALAVSAFILLFPEDTSPPLPDPSSVMDYGVEIIASNLEKPRSVGIAKDGTIFVSEKSGKIRIIDNNLLEKPLITFSVIDSNDAGLLGIAMHPNPTRGEILYAFHTYMHDGHVWNRISMITVENNQLVDVEILWHFQYTFCGIINLRLRKLCCHFFQIICGIHCSIRVPR